MRLLGFFHTTTLTFVDKQHEKDDVYTLRFTPNKPLHHIAGQHSMFTIKGVPGFRIFSLASAPEESMVMIGTHIYAESRFKVALGALRPGDTITMHGPLLDFILNKDDTDIVLVAQGIGITPFRSLLQHLSLSGRIMATTLIHVDRNNHTYQDMTSLLADTALYPKDADEFTRQVQRIAKEKPYATYYVSGSPRFSRITGNTLMDAGIEPSRMKRDSFFGYTKKRKI